MTDQDLIQHLRHSKGWPTLGNAAADRIEVLIAERDRAAQEARAVALREAARIKPDVEVRTDHWRHAALDQETAYRKAILALMDTTHVEAEGHRWRQAAEIGSIHTQADLDRAVAEARAEAYLSGWVNGSNGIEPPDFGNPVFEKAPGD